MIDLRLRIYFVPLLLLALGVFVRGEAQVNRPPAPLTIDEIVKLQQAGFSEDVIITKIKKNGKAFDLSTEELVDLHKIGISDRIIQFLLDPSQPYVAQAAPPAVKPDSPGTAPTAAPKVYPDDGHASKVPTEPGLYLLQGDELVKIDAKILLGSDERSKLKKTKVVAYLVGTESKNRAQQTAPTFYFRLAEGRALEEIVLMAMASKGSLRQIEIGSGGKKPEFKAELMRSFDSLEVGAKLYRLIPAKLSAGEYLFFQIGSAEPAKGSYGKGFDFGIDETTNKQ